VAADATARLAAVEKKYEASAAAAAEHEEILQLYRYNLALAVKVICVEWTSHSL
jgi:hypothetical protein